MTALFHSSPSLREERLPGGAHTSLILRKGQILRLTDIDGGANVSMMMLNPHEKSERLNLPDTLKGQHTARVKNMAQDATRSCATASTATASITCWLKWVNGIWAWRTC